MKVDEGLKIKASWTSARGPTAVVWMSLRRIGWGMYSATGIFSDLGHTFDLLQLRPKDVLELVRQGIERWQGMRVLTHHKE
eukprot:7785958-Pyramimonas_sp.AAC.1